MARCKGQNVRCKMLGATYQKQGARNRCKGQGGGVEEMECASDEGFWGGILN